MVYDPAAQHTHESPLPDARGTKVRARSANPAVTTIGRHKAAHGKKEAAEARTAATTFGTSMVATQA